jgi:hypothetical protein
MCSRHSASGLPANSLLIPLVSSAGICIARQRSPESNLDAGAVRMLNSRYLDDDGVTVCMRLQDDAAIAGSDD